MQSKPEKKFCVNMLQKIKSVENISVKYSSRFCLFLQEL